MSDRLLKSGTAAAVLLVAFIAAVISYQHLYSLAITHGEPRLDATLIPLAIDGTVITASLLMLRAARAGLRTPWLARLMLVAAVAMTVAANVAFGWRFAAWGVLMAGFPAAAFLGNAEATIMFGRQDQVSHSAVTSLPHGGEFVTPECDSPDPVPSSGFEAAKARLRFAAEHGFKISDNELSGKFSLTRAATAKARQEVLAESNGHSPE